MPVVSVLEQLFSYLFLIPPLSHQLALMMLLNTWANLSKKCSSTPEPLVHVAPHRSAGLHALTEGILARFELRSAITFILVGRVYSSCLR